ncbi:hypothetical protein JCM10450v2_001134 [Rhodotorula kratochvilovae]
MPTHKALLWVSRDSPARDCNLSGLNIQVNARFDALERRVVLQWTDAKDVVAIEWGTVDFTYSNPATPHTWVFLGTVFPYAPSATILSEVPSNLHFGARFQVEVVLKTPETGQLSRDRRIEALQQEPHEAKLPSNETTAAFSLAHGQVVNDVCIDFPHFGRQLWTTESSLVTYSKHFKDVLSSDFSEGTATTERPSTKSRDDWTGYTFDDSDEETDAKTVKRMRRVETSTTCTPYKRIEVTETTYTTYFSVLLWLQTRSISFAPLLSSFAKDGRAADLAAASRQSAIHFRWQTQKAGLPPPASPKSINRLADFLSLNELKFLALKDLVSQLTPQNAAYELYSDVATCYAPVRDAVLEYVVKNWREVKSAKATQVMEERAAAGELAPATAATSMMLARWLAEKAG